MFYPRNSTHVIVPAQPGWYVVWPWNEEGKEGVTLDPVIAWVVVHSVQDYRDEALKNGQEKLLTAHPYPICGDGVEENIGDTCALKSPDGRFNIPNVSLYEDEASFLKAWWEQRPKRD